MQKRTIRILCAVLCLLLSAAAVRAEGTEITHEAYLFGFPDGTIRPESILTREQLAQILYRMLPEESKTGCEEVHFPDVSRKRWSWEAVTALTDLRILTGKTDGKYHPSDGVSRRELAGVLAQIAWTEQGRRAFPDIAAYWSAQELRFDAETGWASGLTDGVFRPDEPLTRGEFSAIFNRILERQPDALEHMMVGMTIWRDNADTSAEWFLDLQEASTTHSCRLTDAGEIWLGIG